MSVAQCMADIEKRVPKWLAKSSPTRNSVLRRIEATVRILAKESRQILDLPKQAHADIKAALKEAERLERAIKALGRNHSAFAAGSWSNSEGFSRGQRAREFFDKHELGTAYDVGLDFVAFQAALAGFVQRLSETEEIGRARKGAPVLQLEIELFTDLSSILAEAKEKELVEFKKKDADTFLDYVAGAIDQHLPDLAFRRPDDKTLKRHQAEAEKNKDKNDLK